LDFPGKLHEDLKKQSDSDSLKLQTDIEDAWSRAPKEMKARFKDLSGTGFTSYRGLIFELYIFRTLINSNFDVSYEYSHSGTAKSIDFLAKNGEKELLVEVTSLGPNESGIKNPNYEIDPEGFLRVRKALRNKLGKVTETPKYPTILALCNSHENFQSTKFEKVQALYGTLAIQLNLESNASKIVLTDKGFWPDHDFSSRGFSGVYFTAGIYPGFSYLGQPEIWLNPISPINLMLNIWPEDVQYFKSDERLFRTSKSEKYIWQCCEIF